VLESTQLLAGMVAALAETVPGGAEQGGMREKLCNVMGLETCYGNGVMEMALHLPLK
jgi:hypothetical protein